MFLKALFKNTKNDDLLDIPSPHIGKNTTILKFYFRIDYLLLQTWTHQINVIDLFIFHVVFIAYGAVIEREKEAGIFENRNISSSGF